MGKTVTLRRGGCIETVKIEELEKKEIHTLDDIYALLDGKRAEFPIKQRVIILRKRMERSMRLGKKCRWGFLRIFPLKQASHRKQRITRMK